MEPVRPTPEEAAARRAPGGRSLATGAGTLAEELVLERLGVTAVEAWDWIPECSARQVQWRRPRSKKKRIRKKWAKNPLNWRTERRRLVYLHGNTAYMHPNTLEALLHEAEAERRRVLRAVKWAWAAGKVARLLGVGA